jgi:hypothetical protein
MSAESLVVADIAQANFLTRWFRKSSHQQPDDASATKS